MQTHPMPCQTTVAMPGILAITCVPGGVPMARARSLALSISCCGGFCSCTRTWMSKVSCHLALLQARHTRNVFNACPVIALMHGRRKLPVGR